MLRRWCAIVLLASALLTPGRASAEEPAARNVLADRDIPDASVEPSSSVAKKGAPYAPGNRSSFKASDGRNSSFAKKMVFEEAADGHSFEVNATSAERRDFESTSEENSNEVVDDTSTSINEELSGNVGMEDGSSSEGAIESNQSSTEDENFELDADGSSYEIPAKESASVIEENASELAANESSSDEVNIGNSYSVPDKRASVVSPDQISPEVNAGRNSSIATEVSDAAANERSEVTVGRSYSVADKVTPEPRGISNEVAVDEARAASVVDVGRSFGSASEAAATGRSEVTVERSYSVADKVTPEPRGISNEVAVDEVRAASVVDVGRSFGSASEAAATGRSAARGGSSTAPDLEDCWSAMDLACLGEVVARRADELWRQDEVYLTDSLVLEKLGDATDDDDEEVTGRAASWDEGPRLDRVVANLEKVLGSRALHLRLWGDVGVRLARSKDHPGYMETSLTIGRTSPNPAGEKKGKGGKMNKMLLPLLLGFKTAGAIILGITAVKVLLVKALLVSKLALLAALFLVLKKLLSSAHEHHEHHEHHEIHQQPYLYSHYPIPYHHQHHHHQEGGGLGGYGDVQPYYSGYSGHFGASGAGFGPSGGGGGGDLQGHFSENHAATADPGGAAGNSTTAGGRSDVHRLPPQMLRDSGGYALGPPPQRKSFSLVKSSANRVPVVTYLKVVSTGRKA